MTVRSICALLFILTPAVNGWCQPPQPPNNPPQAKRHFDGRWWLKAETDERAGFIEGAADCLTWTAREAGFNAAPGQVADKISRFYRSHPEARSLTVADVWRRVEGPVRADKKPDAKGETWQNPHWYLNGDWWGSVSQTEDAGYLEGYLWCIDNRASPKDESYSQSVAFYQKRIDAYIDAHSKSGGEAVANILRRYRDKDTKSTAK
jgi:hypothetical protein